MTMRYIDPIQSVESLRRDGGLVEADAALRGVGNTLARANAQRLDSAGGLGFLGMRQAFALFGERFLGLDVRRADEVLAKVVKARAKQSEGRLDDATLGITSDRLDSANPTAAIALARELEYIYSEVMREEVALTSLERLFEIDRSVRPGATHYTIRRIESSGEMEIYRAGMRIPLVGIGRDEETAYIKHGVIGLEMDFFSEQSDAYAGIAEYAEKVRAMREAEAEFGNALGWSGSSQYNIRGVFNYPWLLKRKLSTTFDAITTDAEFATNLAALNDIINWLLNRNPRMAGMPLRFIVSPRWHRYMAQQRHPTSQRTLKEVFLADQPWIDSIEEAPEFHAAGPGDEDACLVVPKGAKGPKVVRPVQFAMLPIQTENFGFSRRQAGYASYGGVRFPDVLRSCLVYADIDY